LRDLPPTKRDEAMARLWTKMATLYGEVGWIAHAPESQMHEWASVLGHRTLADIARGLKRLEERPGDWPVKVSAFRDLCREYQPGTFAGNALPPAREDSRLLGHDREDAKTQAAEIIAEIRARMGDQDGRSMMSRAILARMDVLSETRAEAIVHLREHWPAWMDRIDGDQQRDALAALSEDATEVL
jgi:hypothetical protein